MHCRSGSTEGPTNSATEPRIHCNAHQATPPDGRRGALQVSLPYPQPGYAPDRTTTVTALLHPDIDPASADGRSQT